MARKPKSVYQRIEDQKQKINEVEAMLTTLNEELQILELERDDLEMRQLLVAAREKGLNIEQALAKLNSAK